MIYRIKSRTAFLLTAVSVFFVFLSSSPALVLRGPVVSLPTDSWQRQGLVYVPLAAVCRAYGLRLTAVEGGVFIFDSGALHLEVRGGSDRVLINGAGAELPAPAVWRKGKLMVPLDLARRVLPEGRKRGRQKARFSSRRVPRVMLDPGHGGADPGAVGSRGTLEKDVVLAIGRQVKALLEIRGLEVLLTRNEDRKVSLRRRAGMANQSGADILVSIHANAAHNHLAAGVETFYYSSFSDSHARRLAALENAPAGPHPEESPAPHPPLPARARSRRLAGLIQKKLAAVTTGEDRGVKTAGFYVLKYSRIPSVLVETGFLSHRREEDLLGQLAYREKLARAIAGGISDYFQAGNNIKKVSSKQ